jgi:hypothetical protein
MSNRREIAIPHLHLVSIHPLGCLNTSIEVLVDLALQVLAIVQKVRSHDEITIFDEGLVGLWDL